MRCACRLDASSRRRARSGHRPSRCDRPDRRREHDDEDRLVDPLRLVDVVRERERGEQDRHRALQAAPDRRTAARRERRRTGASSAPHDRRARERAPRTPRSARPSAQRPAPIPEISIVRPSATKTTISASVASRFLEAPHLGLSGASTSPTIRPGDEDREEARAVRDASRRRRRAGERERAHVRSTRPSGRAAAAAAPRRGRRRSRRASPIAHLLAEDPHDDPERRVRVRRELDQPEHQRDPDRVVRARLAFEDRAGAALDLAVAEDGEHHRRVGRGDRRAEQPGRHPAEPERPVGEDRRRGRPSRRCPSTPSERDRDRGHAEAPQADRRAAVEEDHDQRDRRHPLDRVGSDRRVERAERGSRRRTAAAERGSTAAREDVSEVRCIEARIRKSLRFAHSGHNSAGKTDRADAAGLPHPALRSRPRSRRRWRPSGRRRRRRRGARAAGRQRDAKSNIQGAKGAIWGQVDKGTLRVDRPEPGRQHRRARQRRRVEAADARPGRHDLHRQEHPLPLHAATYSQVQHRRLGHRRHRGRRRQGAAGRRPELGTTTATTRSTTASGSRCRCRQEARSPFGVQPIPTPTP